MYVQSCVSSPAWHCALQKFQNTAVNLLFNDPRHALVRKVFVLWENDAGFVFYYTVSALERRVGSFEPEKKMAAFM